MPPKKDLSGKRFGRLVVSVCTSKRDAAGAIVWECLCDCGNTAEVSGQCLTKGETKSCGCFRDEVRSKLGRSRAKDISGKTFGKLTAISRTQKKTHSDIIWKCLCECGGIAEVSATQLIQGRTRSCGCRIIEILVSRGVDRRSLPEEAYRLTECERQSKYLQTGYVKSRIVQTTGIANKDITPEMIEAKREQLKMHRELRRLRHGITGKGNTGTESSK